MARFLSGDLRGAVTAADVAGKYIWASALFKEAPEYYYFNALTRAAVHDSAPPDEQRACREALADHQEKFRRWAELCPQNFGAKHAVISAEIARIDGDVEKASRLYDQAIRSARENGFVQHEGIAYELAARFHLGRGLDVIGEAYMREARSCYARWGASGKVRQLDRLYPGQLGATAFVPLPMATVAVRAEQLDLISVIKASQSISSELMLPRQRAAEMMESMLQASRVSGEISATAPCTTS